MLKLTRRQWLTLPWELKVDVQGQRGVVVQTTQGPQPVLVTFVRRVQDADYKQELD